MKNYYQQKKCGFSLTPPMYRATRHKISCYNYFKQRVSDFDDKNPIKIKEKDIANKLVAENYIKVIDYALKNYVPSEYQDAIYDHVINGIDYETLEDKYFFTTTTMKRHTQSFVWGVAHLLGEDFSD